MLVRRAAEALAISAALDEEDAQDDSGVFTRLRSAAQRTWVAFTVITTLANAVVTFDRITGMELLPPPAQESASFPLQRRTLPRERMTITTPWARGRSRPSP